jgi:PKD repeat protein
MLFLATIFTTWNDSIQTKGNSIIWSVSLNVTETNELSDTVGFGEASDAIDGPPVDSYDVVKPPAPMLPYIRMYLNDNLPSPYNALWKDFRHYHGVTKIWNLSVQWMPTDYVSSTIVTISWDPNDFVHSEYGLVTLCTELGTPLQNMLLNNSYSFTCPATIPQNFKIICTCTNNPPEPPIIPNGETFGYHGISYNYVTSSIDPDGDDLYYRFDWGNNITSSWIGPYPSSELIQTSYIWEAPGFYQVKVKARDIHGKQGDWSTSLLVEMMNRAPAQPASPSPQTGTYNIQSNPTLSWAGSDPDGDLVTYDVYFGTMDPPVKVVNNQSASFFSPGVLIPLTTYRWRIISWDSFGSSTPGPLWSFTTKSSDGGSSEPPGGASNQTNELPVADASLSEQTGFIGTFLIFNGSHSYDPDGYLTNWFWDFGDGTNKSGERALHAYQTLGLYTVTLTVTDNKGAAGSDTIIVEVDAANIPPTTPVINGTRTGKKNIIYSYDVRSTDADNDFLQYHIFWGDRTENISGLLPNGTAFVASHFWTNAGKYDITVEANDTTSISKQTTFEVFIDVLFVQSLGFLFDTNNDGVYDSFYINGTGNITHASSVINGSYLLDIDGDGSWDYLFNPVFGSLSVLSTGGPMVVVEQQWVFVLILGVVLVLIGVIVFLYKRNYF